ncbi:uncharacterized protein LOC132294917 isoform X2 [Cornus florida]|uniref:uncharacterized protein LOC132294917 isoform X2 n=1 Tax=Cornus florida TaxID=4283 RepID=UPI0028A01AC5|nr:uncharacterized protein LOC132294917 isoform X2 [Cornus florida]
MAIAATVNQLITLSSTNLLRSSLSPFPKPYSLNHHHYAITHNANPRPITCHAKPNMVEEAEEVVNGVLFDGDDLMDDEDESDEDETESSLDLLFRFLQSMFKKVSKRAKRASRSILPSVISPQLVSFAVDGVCLLASLSIVKALLEPYPTFSQMGMI